VEVLERYLIRGEVSVERSLIVRFVDSTVKEPGS
jgi:hypothetical protein